MFALPAEIIHLSGISWQTYETLLKELNDRHSIDPAPDLVIEINITSSYPNRLQVYADLGVAEVWIYNGDSLTVQQLQNGIYTTS